MDIVLWACFTTKKGTEGFQSSNFAGLHLFPVDLYLSEGLLSHYEVHLSVRYLRRNGALLSKDDSKTFEYYLS